MRLNPDCIRDILLTLDKKLIPNENGAVAPLAKNDILEIDSLSKYSQNEILYTISHLFDDGILKKGKTYISDSFSPVADITSKGYELIDEISSNSKWNKIKDALKSVGEITASAILNVAISKILDKCWNLT